MVGREDGKTGRRMAEEKPGPGRARRVQRNLRQGLSLAWAASPNALVRYTVLGMINAAMPPIVVVLGARLVNQIATGSQNGTPFRAMVPVLAGIWLATAVQRALG